ncbi:hypothetical protein ILP92_08760 [Maribius pontilimi]|uniref:Uncharacterized protein n=1 Tax=Palleronia pontilimi TaxID=1964209 RepID=A0A934IG67_9RHOB|nr:hypothetical protein [Palleronia pontilimi]MBJ3762835.1 hypothetical protein [Palleronia pontilimi]
MSRADDRRRRVHDAARILPLLGVVLFALPVLWAASGPPASSARSGLYIFAVWALLIVAARALAYALSRAERGPRGPGPSP